MAARRPKRPPGTRRSAAPAAPGSRDVALRVLERVRVGDAYANRVLPLEIERARLGPRDAALATELGYGTLRMLGTLDWVIGLYSTRPVRDIEPQALDALRLGTYQLLYTSIPAHAAVGETVGSVRAPRAQGFVNAVLRQIARAREAIPWPQRDGDLVTYLQIRYAHPRWLVGLWLDELGPVETEALCAANNAFPGVGIRVNVSRSTPERVAERLRDHGLDVRPGRYAPAALLVDRGARPSSWPGFDEGEFTVQDEASVLVGEATDDGVDVAVDLCAGPGGKTGHLAERAGRVAALELHHARARLVRDAVAPIGGRVVVVQADGRVPPVVDGVDTVLVDAPCTGLGVLRRRPEARWRVEASDVGRSAELQAELVRAGFGLLRGGGTLVYAVCTVTAAETTDVVEGLLASEGGAELMDVLPSVPRAHGRRTATLQLLPHVHGTDGMFVAKVRRRP